MKLFSKPFLYAEQDRKGHRTEAFQWWPLPYGAACIIKPVLFYSTVFMGTQSYTHFVYFTPFEKHWQAEAVSVVHRLGLFPPERRFINIVKQNGALKADMLWT